MPFYKRLGFWIFVAIISIAAFFIIKRTFNSIEVKVLPATRQELTITVTATSTGTIKSEREMKITAQRMGRISRLFVEEGDVVGPGSKIAELDTEEAYMNLQMAQASMDKAKAILNETETRLKRLNELREKGYISQIDLDSVRRENDVADAALREAKNSLSLAKLNYDYSFIKSPINGVITSRPVKLGETAAKGALVVNIVSTQDLYIEAFIDEADVARVKPGLEVNISMDAYQGKVFKGEVYMISPVVLGGKQETRTFEARTRFREKGPLIKPGMSADVEIIADSVKDAIVVPSQAIIERDGKKLVFVKKGRKAALVSVETGRFNWSFTEIVSGIKDGDVVITNPDVSGLADGKRVKEAKKAK
ncbi:MAG: efflux RND transporter periplasmic adaptor subunit [Nitrospirae bacterium]|nr:MAG: efflux RND transporter periplasmic adaptor subunit [Nitrospirota bacterium]